MTCRMIDAAMMAERGRQGRGAMRAAIPGAILIAAAAFGPAAGAQDLLFARERIEVTVQPPDTVSVSGVYLFVNASAAPLTTPIVYPFPVDSISSYPFSIRVTAGVAGAPVVFTRESGAISFPLSLAADTAEVHAGWREYRLTRENFMPDVDLMARW